MGGQLDLEWLGGGQVEGAKHEQLDGGQVEDGQLGQPGRGQVGGGQARDKCLPPANYKLLAFASNISENMKILYDDDN